MDTPTAEQVADIIARLNGNGYMVEPREAADMIAALQAERESLARRNAELEAEREWRKDEPEDDDYKLMWSDGFYHVAKFDDGEWTDCNGDRQYLGAWQPLPPPPEKEG